MTWPRGKKLFIGILIAVAVLSTVGVLYKFATIPTGEVFKINLATCEKKEFGVSFPINNEIISVVFPINRRNVEVVVRGSDGDMCAMKIYYTESVGTMIAGGGNLDCKVPKSVGDAMFSIVEHWSNDFLDRTWQDNISQYCSLGAII